MKLTHVLGIAAIVVALSRAAPNATRIVGGIDVWYGDYPFVTSLRKTPEGTTKCAGALIHRQFVLTAAKCAKQNNIQFARVGTFYRSGAEDGFPVAVINQIAHPDFDPLSNDFLLLQLEIPVPVGIATPIALAQPDDPDISPGMIATVFGWGWSQEGGPFPDHLRHVDLPIVSNKECAEKINGRRVKVDKTMLCAGGAGDGSKRPTYGDYGGPLIVENPQGAFLVGVVSWGTRAPAPGLPTVYARVSKAIGFIDENLRNFEKLHEHTLETIASLTEYTSHTPVTR
jgi:secreted trypsin-like serine protease